jgi:hypothetical protein
MVVDHLNGESENKNIGIACIYLNHKEAEDQAPAILLSGLWRQLVFGRDVGPRANDLYQWHCEKRTTPSLKEVVDVLHSSFAAFSTVYIIVDAIDEYPEAQRCILLQRLAAMGPTVNLLITSRPHISPDPSFRNLDALEIRASEDDIREYVDSHLRMSRKWKDVQAYLSDDLQQEIHSKISDTVDGM